MPAYVVTLLVIALFGLALGASFVLDQRKQRLEEARREAIRKLADELGAAYSLHGLRTRDDWSADGRRRDVRFLRQFEAMDEWGPVDEGRVENLITFRFPEADLYAFDFVWRTPKVPLLRRTVVAARIRSRLPRVLIAPRVSAFKADRHSLDVPLVKLEWEEFNRRYTVRSDDAKGAHALLAPEVMELLMETDARSWAVGGCHLVAYDHGLNPEGERRSTSEVEALRRHLESMRDLVRRIPSHLLEEGATGHRWASPLF